MKLFFKKYLNQVKDSKMFGKWYGRVVITETIGIEQIATRIQDNCTLKRSDILAVLSELGPTMRDLLQDSKRVQIPYLGAFKLSIKTEGATSADEFTAKNIKDVKVIFQPETVVSGGHRMKELTRNVNLAEMIDYSRPTDEVEP